MMGSNNLINQNMSRSGWPFTCSGRNKPIKCLVTIGCIQSFLCVQNWVYNARHKIVVFASCAAFGMQQLCLSDPDPSLKRVSSLDIYIQTSRDKTSRPQDLPMTWDDQPFYFWRQLNAHFTYNLGSPAFKLIEKVRPTQSQCITKGLFFRNLCLKKRRCNPQSVNHLGIAGCQIYALKKLIQLFCMTWGAQFHWFKHGKIYPRKRVFDSFFSKKRIFGGKNCFFLQKQRYFWKKCKKKHVFGQIVRYRGVSLV